MAALTYSNLIGVKTEEDSIKHWLNWAKAPSVSIVRNAEAWIYQRLRVREMRQLATGTISDGDTDVPLPTGYLQSIHFGLDGDYQASLSYLDPDLFERHLAFDAGTTDLIEATPSFFTTDGTVARLNSEADVDYTYRWWHYATPSSLAATTNETNFLTSRYPHLLTCACLYWAHLFRKDEKEAKNWLALASDAVKQAKIEEDLEKVTQSHEVHWGDN